MKYFKFSIFFLFATINFAFAQDLNKTMQLYKAGKYKEAIPDFERAIPYIETNYGKFDTVYYSRILFYTAKSYEGISDFAKAKQYYLRTCNIYENFHKFSRVEYAESCISLAKIAETEDNFSESEKYELKAKTGYAQLYGKKSRKYARVCNNLASLYRKNGKFNEAEAFFTEAKNIYAEKYGKQHPDYAVVCDNLALLYEDKGDYDKAEKLFLEAKRINEKLFGKDNENYAIPCNNLGVLYSKLGNYEKSEQLLTETEIILKKQSEKNNPKYASVCNNLGQLYLTKKEYEKSEIYFSKAAAIYENLYGKNSSDYVTVLNNTASLNAEKGAFNKAKILFTEVKDITADISGKSSAAYATACNNAAAVFYWSGEYAKAEPLYKEAEKIFFDIYGERHYNYMLSNINLALLYDAEGKYKIAKPFYLKANQILNNLAAESANFMSEKERERYINSYITENTDICMSFFADRAQKDKELAGILYDDALNLKGKLLKSVTAIRKAAVQSKDTALLNNFNEMIKTAKIISAQYSLPKTKRRTDLKEYEEKENNLEKELNRKFKKYKQFLKLRKISRQDIVKNLKYNEAAIEFIDFKYHTNKNEIKGIRYYALILKNEYEFPKIVFLFEEKDLQKKLYRNPGDNEYRYIKKLYDPKSKKAQELYKMIWQPVEPFLKNTENIYISPSGLLNKISFDALPSDTSTLISDKYKIICTVSTSEVVNSVGLYPKDIKNSVLFGGLKYELSPEEMKKNSEKFKSPDSGKVKKTSEKLPDSESIDSITRNVVWNYLPGSLEEVNEIQSFIKEKHIPVIFYQGKDGTEEQFKALEKDAPSILHISTHGFYFGNNEESEAVKNIINPDVQFVFSEDPLLRSGFILAGGNRAFQGETVPAGTEDGVLTASEISNLNFFNTKLVVLSACQTGLGDVKGNEGVYGLQRSFKMAGVDYLLFSLWEVPDEATKELMADFYENWFSGMEIRSAFKKAQNQLKEKYKGIPGAAFAWAAFVLKK